MTSIAFSRSGFKILVAIDALPVESIRSFGNLRVFTLGFMTFYAGLGICFPCFEGMVAICAGKCVTGCSRMGFVVK